MSDIRGCTTEIKCKFVPPQNMWFGEIQLNILLVFIFILSVCRQNRCSLGRSFMVCQICISPAILDIAFKSRFIDHFYFVNCLQNKSPTVFILFGQHFKIVFCIARLKFLLLKPMLFCLSEHCSDSNTLGRVILYICKTSF